YSIWRASITKCIDYATTYARWYLHVCKVLRECTIVDAIYCLEYIEVLSFVYISDYVVTEVPLSIVYRWSDHLKSINYLLGYTISSRLHVLLGLIFNYECSYVVLHGVIGDSIQHN